MNSPASHFAFRFYQMLFKMDNCIYILRDNVTHKDIHFIFIYREVFKMFLRIKQRDYT